MTNRWADFILAGGAVILLAGCGPREQRDTLDAADINAAAEAAQDDIDTYAANRLEQAPVTTPPPTRPEPTPAATPGADGPDDAATEPAPDATEGPAENAADNASDDAADDAGAEEPQAGDRQAARDVVRRYYALIAARNYPAAYRLWDDNGRATGQSQRAFANSFARYARYRAEVGAPGRVDAGAGQRFVKVPVHVTGTLTDRRRPFVLDGAVTLHRTAAIPGATAEQRAWRIRASSLRPATGTQPQPDPAPSPDATAGPKPATATTYRCGGQTRLSVRVDPDADSATVRRGARELAVLAQQRAGTGVWYKGDGYELRGRGATASLTRPGAPRVACTAQ